METATVSITPFQVLFALMFQLWLIIFPIIIIRKLNYLTELLRVQLEEREGQADDSRDQPGL